MKLRKRKISVLAGCIGLFAIVLGVGLWQTMLRPKPIAEPSTPVYQFVDPEADEEFFRRTIEKYEGEVNSGDTWQYRDRMIYLGVVDYVDYYDDTGDVTLIKLDNKQIDKQAIAFHLFYTALYYTSGLPDEEKYDLTPDELEYYLYGRGLDEEVDEDLREKVQMFWAYMGLEGQLVARNWWNLVWDVENYNKTAPADAQIDLDNLDEVLAAAQEHGWRY